MGALEILRLLAPLLALAAIAGLVKIASSRARARALARLHRRLDDHRPGAAAPWRRGLFEVEDEPHTWAVDDRTWSDLDLDQVFVRLDRTVSPVGSQVLYQMLRRPCLHRSALDRRSRVIRVMADADHRQRVELALLAVADERAGRLTEMLWRQPPRPPAWALVAPLLTATAAVALALAWWQVWSWLPVVVLLAVNSIVHFAHRRHLEDLPLAALGALLAAAAVVAEDTSWMPEEVRRPFHEAVRATRGLRRRLAPLGLEDGLGLTQYVTIFFLVDVLAYRAAHSALTRVAGHARTIFVTLGQLDAGAAIQRFSHSDPGPLCRPTFTDADHPRSFTGAWHPLVAAPVPCSLHDHPRAMLITGSNMAGKTTFLKTLGVNAILAQAADLALASTYAMPWLRVLTSIGRADNIVTGRSYYLAEVESVLRLVRAAGGDDAHLLIADEVFRGTNPDERIAGATAVLEHLGRPPHLVAAATHDLELVELLDGHYRCFHFSEAVDEQGLRFDYVLRPGPSTTRNAIALLHHTGYPAEVVARARDLSQR